MPVVAIVEGYPDLSIGGRVQQPLFTWIFADRVRDGSGGDAIVDLRPSLAAVVRAPEMWIHVIQAESVRGGVRGLRVKVAGIHVEDTCPGFDLRRSDVRPFRAAVERDLNQAVAGARPEHVHVEG